MNYSLNEIEALAKRAARGGGFSWGLAAEAGLGVRALVSFGYDGPGAMAKLLVQNDGVMRGDVTPQSLAAEWRAARGLCPITAGASLVDYAKMAREQGGLAMRAVSYPLLVVPFVRRAAVVVDRVISLAWEGVEIVTDGRNLAVFGAAKDLESATVDRLVVRFEGDLGMVQNPKMRGQIRAGTMACLSEFAARTYAPATDESRVLGAG